MFRRRLLRPRGTYTDWWWPGEGYDGVEHDLLIEHDPGPDALQDPLARLRAAGRPVIFTARAATEGGRLGDDGLRRALYAVGLTHAGAIDVEIASTALAGELVPRARAAGKTVILSAHATTSMPTRDR